MNHNQMERYRTFWPRFWANLADTVICIPLSLIAPRIVNFSSPTWVVVTWLVFSSFFFVVYSILMHSWRGQTLGKITFRIRVLDLSEQPLSIRQAILRDAVNLVFSLFWMADSLLNLDAYIRMWHAPETVSVTMWHQVLLYFPVAWVIAELVSTQTNAKRRAIHDWIAGSVVVNERATETS